MVTIRLAKLSDLPAIMEIEEQTFGFDPNAMAPMELMRSRIVLCNASSPGWFWVAEEEEDVVTGYLILQPTNLTPDECTSWTVATDDGTFQKTFDPNGENVFAASLAVRQKNPKASPGTADLLVHHSLVIRLAERKKIYILCSRMPGFKSAHEHDGVTPEEYWQLTRADGLPKDPMLREYYLMSGEKPTKLMLNGFPPDEDSGGHGVLYALTDPVLALDRMAARIYRTGMVAGKRKTGE